MVSECARLPPAAVALVRGTLTHLASQSCIGLVREAVRLLHVLGTVGCVLSVVVHCQRADVRNRCLLGPDIA